ncbi:MAG: YdbH domain-containing protein [Planctomycetota bacterium]|nr:YdbH domain-containing protein [Planctomycetota bacterium]
MWILPKVVETELLASLREVGFADADLESLRVGFGHAIARNVRLGSGEPGTGTLVIATVTARFSWADLFDASIDSLVLDGAIWTRSDLPGRGASPFDRLHGRGAAGTGPMRALPDLHMRHIGIRGGRIETPASRTFSTIAVDATLTAEAPWRIEVDASAGAQRIHASAVMRDEQQSASGTLELRGPGATPIAFAGTCQLAADAEGRSLAVALRREAGPFELDVADATWSGEGTFELQAEIPFPHLADSALALRLDGFDFASTTGVSIHGLSTDMHLLGLPVPIASGPQQVRWRDVQFGEFRGGAGNAELQVDDGAQVRVKIHQRTDDDVGSIDIGELRWAPGTTSFPATIAVHRMPLQQWLEVLSQHRVTGEGRIDGTLSVVVHTAPRLSVDMLAGGLAAAPGGTVRFLDDADTEALLLEHVSSVAAATDHPTVVQQRLVEALKEFSYSVLDFRIVPDAGGAGVTLRVHAAGQGRKVPQQLDLEVNLHGFDAAVDTAIALKLGIDRAKERLGRKVDRQPDNPRMQRRP